MCGPNLMASETQVCPNQAKSWFMIETVEMVNETSRMFTDGITSDVGCGIRWHP